MILIGFFQGQFEVKYAVDKDSKTRKATYSHKLEIKSEHERVHYGLQLLETLRWPSGYGYFLITTPLTTLLSTTGTKF